MSDKEQPKLPHLPAVLNKRQVAEYWSVCEKTVERWTAEGIHPKPFHMGGLTYWYRSAIDQLASQRFQAANDQVSEMPEATEEPVRKPRKPRDRRQGIKRPGVAENPFVPIEVLAPRRE